MTTFRNWRAIAVGLGAASAVLACAGAVFANPAAESVRPAGFVSTLSTADQEWAEKIVLRIIAASEVRAARARARALMAASPLAKESPDARARLDYALDKWLVQLARQDVDSDLEHPRILWNTNLAKYHWFGFDFPGSGSANDNPDNTYRHVALDGASRYELLGQLRPMHPVQLTLQLERYPEGLGFALNKSGTDIENFVTLTDKDLDIAADGSFRITLDSSPAEGRRNYIQLPSGKLYLLIRDTMTDWKQNPIAFSIRRLSGPPSPPPLTEQELTSRVAQQLPGYVAFWLRYVEGVRAKVPQENTLREAAGRAGGYGYIGQMRFNMRDDQALVVTIDGGHADYVAAQVSDPWQVAPSPTEYLMSRNQAQSEINPDGTLTYVLALRDPGVANWIDAAGLHSGWFVLRWQGMPHDNKSGDGLIRSVTLVELKDLARILPAPQPTVSPDERRKELAMRAAEWRLRVAEPTN
jgi:hypothetical protein